MRVVVQWYTDEESPLTNIPGEKAVLEECWNSEEYKGGEWEETMLYAEKL